MKKKQKHVPAQAEAAVPNWDGTTRHAPDYYIDLGMKAARAKNQIDEPRRMFYVGLYDQAIAAEDSMGRRQAEVLFKESYSGFCRTP